MALGQARWQAFATGVVLRVTDPAALACARTAVKSELDAIDLACSRFRPDSELSRLNERAGRPTRVSVLLAEALELALRAAALTDGDVDPTIGRALELAEAGRRTTVATITLRARSGWRSVGFDRHSATVRVPRGIRLDLGATAKAWAADRAVAAAAAAAGCGALVSIGGDIATRGDAPSAGWRVHVTDDHRSTPNAPGQTVAIFDGGLATSSVTVRRWRAGTRTMHHIIDPHTGMPALSAWRTVSVAAASCAEANIATTAALVRGERAGAWLSELELPARLVDTRGHAQHLGGWPTACCKHEHALQERARELRS